MHRWQHRGPRKRNWTPYYRDWLFGRRTLAELCERLAVSYPTLTRAFDGIDAAEGLQVSAPDDAINLLIDATFFGRAYGYLCFHDTHRIIWFREIKTEGVAPLRAGLRELSEAGFRFKSVTIDGRRGYFNTLRHMLGPVPIQMCLYHQKAVVRRYITDHPRSRCGQELQALMKSLCVREAHDFINAFYLLRETHHSVLEERNEAGEYAHQKLRAAYRSVQENMPHLFTYQDLPYANIPTTIKHLEGTFAHLKEKIKIHRGLHQHRKKKAIRFILSSPPLF